MQGIWCMVRCKLCLRYLSASNFSLAIVSEMFGGGVLVALSGLLGKVLVHILCLQAFFSLPAPPNFFISLHVIHSPQSFLWHPSHQPHLPLRLFLLFCAAWACTCRLYVKLLCILTNLKCYLVQNWLLVLGLGLPCWFSSPQMTMY